MLLVDLKVYALFANVRSNWLSSSGVACNHWPLLCICHRCVGRKRQVSYCGAMGVACGVRTLAPAACSSVVHDVVAHDVLVLLVEVEIDAKDVTMLLSGWPGDGPFGGRVVDHALTVD
jgi:hypothetical protein